MAKLEVKNLMQQYLYGAAGVRDLSFLVENSAFVVMGSEESGKSSLLRTLSGKDLPTRGEILYNNLPISATPIKERSIVYVRERDSIFKLRSVFYNLAYPLKIRKMSKVEIETRVCKALEICDLLGQKNVRAGKLSAYQTATLKLARCFVRDVDFYFIDCVQKGLSIEDRATIFSTIYPKILALDGVKIFATELFFEAKMLAENGVVLYYGVTEQCGKLNDFYSAPSTLEVFRITHGELSVEEGVLNVEKGEILCAEKKILCTYNSEQKDEIEVFVATAISGETKVFYKNTEKLLPVD